MTGKLSSAPLVIDELGEWTRERYEIKPIIISRSEPVRLVVNGREYIGGVDISNQPDQVINLKCQ